jgi:hypothetical protein
MFVCEREIARFRMDEITATQQSMDMATSKGVSMLMPYLFLSISNTASASSVELQPHSRRTLKIT